MVAAGLVDRRAASNDRRRVELAVTPQGRELAMRAQQIKRSYGASTAAKLDNASLTAACTALKALLHDTPSEPPSPSGVNIRRPAVCTGRALNTNGPICAASESMH